jgi:6-oxocyclohex-1-ene-1-carbonyl-CoA hydrolase
MLNSHTLVDGHKYEHIQYELRPVKDPAGNSVNGLHSAWIILDNPKQFNSYTTDAVKDVILAFREASMDRSVVAVVFTAVGDKAFCTGGNTKEYAEYYAGNPQEYKQYMRLFNDMISASPPTRPGSARPVRSTAPHPTAAPPTSCRCTSGSRAPWRVASCARCGARTRRCSSA